MDSVKARCTKILDNGKGKGRKCRNLATSNGLCKIHATTVADSDKPTSFNSDKLGLERYRELSRYLNNEEQTSPSESTNQRADQERLLLGPSLPPKKRFRHASFSDAEMHTDDTSEFPDSSSFFDASEDQTFKNKKRKKNEVDVSHENTYASPAAIAIFGVHELTRCVEDVTPKMTGLTDALFKNEYWHASLLQLIESKAPSILKDITPEVAFMFSTVIVASRVYRSNTINNIDLPKTNEPVIIEEKNIDQLYNV